MDPQAITRLTSNRGVQSVAFEAEVRLRRVCDALDKSR